MSIIIRIYSEIGAEYVLAPKNGVDFARRLLVPSDIVQLR